MYMSIFNDKRLTTGFAGVLGLDSIVPITSKQGMMIHKPTRLRGAGFKAFEVPRLQHLGLLY